MGPILKYRELLYGTHSLTDLHNYLMRSIHFLVILMLLTFKTKCCLKPLECMYIVVTSMCQCDAMCNGAMVCNGRREGGREGER